MSVPLSQRVKEAREYRGFSQTLLAEKMGSLPRDISAMERGKKKPSLGTIIGMCRALRVSSDYILGLIPDMKEI